MSLLIQNPHFDDSGKRLTGDPATDPKLPWYWGKSFQTIFAGDHYRTYPQNIVTSRFLGSVKVVTKPFQAIADLYNLPHAHFCRSCPPLKLYSPKRKAFVSFRCVNPFPNHVTKDPNVPDLPDTPVEPVQRRRKVSRSSTYKSDAAQKKLARHTNIPKRSGRPRSPFLVCDDPTASTTPPTQGSSPPLLTASACPDPNRCWFWAGRVYVDLGYKPSKGLYKRPPRIYMPPRGGLSLPFAAYHHFYPHKRLPLQLAPCYHPTRRFYPFPGRPNLYLDCINPNHRVPTDAITQEGLTNHELVGAAVVITPHIAPNPTTSTSTTNPPSSPEPLLQLHHTRFYEDLFTAVPNPPDTIDELLALPPFHIPPEPPYTREEIVSHINEAHTDLALPPSWKKLHKP
jgi:hypothetical protein